MKRITITKEAAYVAISAHGFQTYAGYPYYYHLEQVVDVLKEFGYTEDKFVCAGYLHDSIEDGDLSYNDVKKKFGEEIAEIVFCVTDEMGRNRREKKAKTLPKIASNRDAIVIKLADRIANLRQGIKDQDDRRMMYVKEHDQFEAMLHEAGHADEMWAELRSLVASLTPKKLEEEMELGHS